jgi:hypothetical protein
VPGWPEGEARFFDGRHVALAASLGLHMLVVALAAQMSWSVVERLPTGPTPIVWLESRPAVTPAPADEPEPVAETRATTPDEVAPESAAERAPAAAEESTPPRVEAQSTPPAARASDARAPSEVVETPTTESNAAPALPPVIDFEAERARAIAEVLEEQARESRLRRPTAEELMKAAPEPAAPSKPKRSIFTPGGNHSGPSLARPGQARTRFGRALVDLCHALTGGFGVGFQGHTFFSLCARGPSGPTGLFPEVMPAYLKLKPECAEVEPVGPVLPEASLYPTVKCRLVPKTDEIQRTP